MNRTILSTLLTFAFATAPGASASGPPDCELPAANADGSGAEPIRSRAELDAWLARRPSPLDLMTPGARARFLDGLAFNERGLVRISSAELEAELITDHVHQVMRLFGLQAPASIGLSPEEAARLRAARTAEEDGEASDIERRFDRLYHAHRDLPAGTAEQETDVIGSLYDSLFPQGGRKAEIEAAGSHDLRLLYRAAGTAFWYSYADTHLDAMQDALSALERRGLATRDDIETMYKLLVHSGRLDESRAFALRHATRGLQPLPPGRESAAVEDAVPSAWNVSASEHALLHEAIALAPVRIVVVASYGCGFSRAAAQAIPHDPVLGPIFREHAVWIASPRHLDDLKALRRWNEDNPEAALMVAVSRERWPMVDLDIVPQFHIFRDDELIASVTSGWPVEEGNRDAVLAALHEAGLGGNPTPSP